MNRICEVIKANKSEVLADWEELVRAQPWYSLPPEDRLGQLESVLLGLAEAALGKTWEVETHRVKILAAAAHGQKRREQGIPEHLILTEYHLLRQCLWRFLLRNFGSSPLLADAIMRIDVAITGATNASMWGYYRTEIEAMGKWEESLQRLVEEVPHPDYARQE